MAAIGFLCVCNIALGVRFERALGPEGDANRTDSTQLPQAVLWAGAVGTSFAAQDGVGEGAGTGVPVSVGDGDMAGEADAPGLPDAPGEAVGT